MANIYTNYSPILLRITALVNADLIIKTMLDYTIKQCYNALDVEFQLIFIFVKFN